MKKRKMVFLLWFVGLLFSTQSPALESPEEKFNNIKEIVINSIKGISNYGAEDAYEMIADSLSNFKRLHQEVKDAEYIDEVIDDVTESLDEIATTYEKVSDLKDDIAEFRGDKLYILKDVKGDTIDTTEDIARRKREIISETNALKEKLSVIEDNIEKQKIEVSIKGNESILYSIEGQEKIWRKFGSAQEKLISKLELNGKKIDLLLHVLKTNALVYREASNVAKLRRSAKAALKNLSSLSDIQSILGDLQNSWLDVNDLVSEISNAEFNVEL